jgi:hypothetical protein
MTKPPKKPAGEKQKPERKVVHKGAKGLGTKSTPKVQKSMDARILADQRNDPKPNRKDPSPPKGSGKGKAKSKPR